MTATRWQLLGVSSLAIHPEEAAIQFKDRYPIIVTPKMAACRDFWVRHLGAEVAFENDWFCYLAGDGLSIAFMTPEHPSAPPGPEPYTAGISMELEVEDATAALAELRATGREPDYPLTDEAFGQRRFSVRDPSGLWINIVQQVSLPS
jgi:catechol 2,3-dioxygenase-like lactoylglutathione lyase family enzyme